MTRCVTHRWLLLATLTACRFDGGGLGFDDEDPGEPGAEVPGDERGGVASCAALPPGSPSAVYTLAPDDGGPLFDAYCNMHVDGGGWTLALKADGRTATFAYDAGAWSTREPLSPDAADLDRREAKLASFARLPVREVLVALTDLDTGNERLVVLPAEGPSLLALVTGPERVVGDRRQPWLDALPGSALQQECTMEGFNLGNDWNQLRIGVVANNEAYECESHDSRIGVGGGGCSTCTHCGIGPGMSGPAVGNNFKGCSALPAFAAVYVR